MHFRKSFRWHDAIRTASSVDTNSRCEHRNWSRNGRWYCPKKLGFFPTMAVIHSFLHSLCFSTVYAFRSRLSGERCSWCPSFFLRINGRSSWKFVRPFRNLVNDISACTQGHLSGLTRGWPWGRGCTLSVHFRWYTLLRASKGGSAHTTC